MTLLVRAMKCGLNCATTLNTFALRFSLSIHSFTTPYIMYTSLSEMQCLSVNHTWSFWFCLYSVPHVTITMSRFSSPRSSIEEQRDLWERKRSITAKELVQTEQCYCQQLHLVTTVCILTVKSTGLTSEWLH